MLNKLSDLKVKKLHKEGRYSDGGNLYLQIKKMNGRIYKSWVFRYQSPVGEKWMGLGPIGTISLGDARAKALEYRRQRLDGIDPIQAREAALQKRAVDAARSMTFDQCRDQYITAHRPGWKSIKHLKQWTGSLQKYVTPVFGRFPVSMIDTALVTKVLDPLWPKSPVTASRIRGRIEAILDWAKVRGFRTGENPARWEGHLEKTTTSKRKVQHHPAMPYADIPAFMAALRKETDIGARALEFTILTASRSAEVTGARWTEFNGDWTIPGDRIKSGREHRVPLSSAAFRVFEQMKAVQHSDLVFPIGDKMMIRQLRKMAPDLTVHGFRSSFRDWAAEQTQFSNEVCEAALAHIDRVEAAYRRGDLFDKRRALMEAWAAFCGNEKAENVVELKRLQ